MSKLINYVFDVSLLEHLTKKGVYKINHLSKDKLFYIGSASGIKGSKDCQLGFYRRFLEHLRALEQNKHDSKYLQNVVNKYGIEGIRFEILEIVETENRKVILEREQYYLDTLKPAYNSSTIAKCPTIPYTDARKLAISKRMKGKALSSEVYDTLRNPVYQFTKKGLFIKEYKSIQEASINVNIDRASISKAASGKRTSAGGYLWSFINSVNVPISVLIYQYTIENKLIRTFDTLEEVKKELKLTSSTSIRACFKGKQKQAYGFKWTRPILQRLEY